MCMPIQQQRTQCPSGCPSVISSAWLSAEISSESLRSAATDSETGNGVMSFMANRITWIL
jgi:hypothetical protein